MLQHLPDEVECYLLEFMMAVDTHAYYSACEDTRSIVRFVKPALILYRYDYCSGRRYATYREPLYTHIIYLSKFHFKIIDDCTISRSVYKPNSIKLPGDSHRCKDLIDLNKSINNNPNMISHEYLAQELSCSSFGVTEWLDKSEESKESKKSNWFMYQLWRVYKYCSFW